MPAPKKVDHENNNIIIYIYIICMKEKWINIFKKIVLQIFGVFFAFV